MTLFKQPTFLASILRTSGSMNLNTPKTISLLHLKKAGYGEEFVKNKRHFL